MRTLTICLLAASVCLSGCATHGGAPLEDRARISYYDRNGDGKVDLEYHRHPGVADADWELRDDDHDGRYEKKVLFGVGVFESAVDIRVPTGVKIKRTPKGLIAGYTDEESGPNQKSALAQESGPEARTVRGVLRHFPNDVKSAQAWHGHNFIVDNTPVIATEKVPEETLKRFVGLGVVVTGVWHPGKQWNPTDEETNMPMPLHLNSEVVVRGDGLKALSINTVGK